MTRRSADDVAIAELLLAHEAGSGGDEPASAVRVHDKLAARLSPLIGVAGMRALIERSAKLTRAEYPCFAAATANGDSARLAACFAELEPAAVHGAAAALYGTLLGLLMSFIGERLVWQVLRSAFPAMPQSVPKETDR